jgi:putative membrane protein
MSENQSSPKPLSGIDPTDPRVLMAAERTLLAWVRTGLAMMGFGFVVARFGLFLREIAAASGKGVTGGQVHSLWIGVGLVLAGVWVLMVSAVHHRRYARNLAAGRHGAPLSPVFGLAVSLLLAALGLAMAWYLLKMAR